MKKPKWQRARFVNPYDESYRGREVWIKIGSKGRRFSRSLVNGRSDVQERYETHVQSVNSIELLTVVRVDSVELLARDESDFAEDVPLVRFEDWLNDKEPRISQGSLPAEEE